MPDFAYPFSVPLDGSGNGTIDLTAFFVPTMYQVFNIGANVPGTNGTQVMQVLLNGVPYQQANGASPQLGPIYLHSQKVVLSITGGTANGVAQGYVQGAEESAYNDLPNLSGPATNNVSINGGTVSLSGPVSITGPVNVENTDPSLFLSGAVGDPFVENQSFTVPNRNLNPNFVVFPTVGFFECSGFAAFFIYGDPNTSANIWYMHILWADEAGNTIGITQIDSLANAFAFVVGVQSRKCQIGIFNQDTVNHGISNFNVIPLLQLPANPALLLGNPGATFGTFDTTIFRGILIADIRTVAAGNSVNIFADAVWPGRAFFSIGALSGKGNSAWNATLQCLAQDTSVEIIGRWAGTGGEGPIIPPTEVQLTSGQPMVVYTNTDTNPETIYTSLIAA